MVTALFLFIFILQRYLRLIYGKIAEFERDSSVIMLILF